MSSFEQRTSKPKLYNAKDIIPAKPQEPAKKDGIVKTAINAAVNLIKGI
jgi:hypothetical protein